MDEQLSEIYTHDVDRWADLVSRYRMEGNPTEDECESCGEDFGESGETKAGWNCECVSCGGREYETKPSDEDHFETWALDQIEKEKTAVAA
jgi:hypothetical protein